MSARPAFGGQETLPKYRENPLQTATDYAETSAALEGEGAVTVVDGKPCPMARGDMILTPGIPALIDDDALDALAAETLTLAA